MSRKRKQKHRSSWKLLSLIALLLILPVVLYQVSQTQLYRQFAASEKPNIILIVSDDQPKGTMNYIPGVRDSLGKNGVTFTNAYVTTGLCCPSRASILTGQYAHNHKVLNNRPPNGGVQKFVDKETLPVWLQKAGYKTSLIGKYMNEYDSLAPYIPPGWDNWVAFDDDNGKYFDYKLTDNGKSESYGKSENDYSTDVLAKKAINFIKRTNEPFFLYFAPHTPHGVPRPAPRHENKCDNAQLKKNPNFNEDDVSDKPKWIQDLPKLSEKDIKDNQREFERKMCTLKALDEAVSDILKALGNKRENTIVIYISDNGYVFGEHRWQQKECFYEECVAVDMIISYPKLTSGEKTSDQFALNIDLAPTLLELAGVSIPESVDGKSLVPLLKGENTPIHESFLIETYNNESNPKGEDYGIRKGDYKYQELFTGEKELYDLAKDPYELENVVDDPAYTTIQTTLADDLKKSIVIKNPTDSTEATPKPTRSKDKDKKKDDKKKDKDRDNENDKDRKKDKDLICRLAPNLSECKNQQKNKNKENKNDSILCRLAPFLKECKDNSKRNSTKGDNKCQKNNDCRNDELCKGGKCEKKNSNQCKNNNDCAGDKVCRQGKCEKKN